MVFKRKILKNKCRYRNLNIYRRKGTPAGLKPHIKGGIAASASIWYCPDAVLVSSIRCKYELFEYSIIIKYIGN